jgi:hypothetical protein
MNLPPYTNDKDLNSYLFLVQQELNSLITTFKGLTDVSISDTLANGDLLKWNATLGKWENVAGASGTFTTVDSKTVTVTNGIITNII